MALTFRLAKVRRAFTPHLTEEQRDQIRAMHTANPRMKYREIGALFGVSISCVCTTLNAVPLAKRKARQPSPEPPKTVMRLPPTCSVKQPDSIISPIPVSRLMGGNARRARAPAC